MNTQTAVAVALYDEVRDSSGLSSLGENNVSPDEIYKIKSENSLIIDLDFKNLSINDNISHATDTNYATSNRAQYSFSVLQEWEGYVVSISDTTFTARLVDVTRNCLSEEEEVDLLLNDLEDADKKRISLGSIFRWVIGYNRSPGGTKDRSSRIVLRDMPVWTKKEIEKNWQEAAEWASQLNVE